MMARLHRGSIELEYCVDGPAQGRPIVLSTGFGDQLTFWPDSLIDSLLGAGYRVVRFDTRDAGLSSDGASYDLNDLALDLLEVIGATGAQRAHVLGYSMGGQIALRAALASPESISALALVFTSSGAAHLSRPRTAALMASLAVSQRTAMDKALAARLELMRVTSGNGYPYDEAEARQTARADLDRAYRPEGTGRHMQALLTSAPIHERLGELRVPATVVQAGDDCFFGLDHGKDLAERLGAPLSVVDGAGHNLTQAVGRAVAERVLPFFIHQGGPADAENR